VEGTAEEAIISSSTTSASSSGGMSVPSVDNMAQKLASRFTLTDVSLLHDDYTSHLSFIIRYLSSYMTERIVRDAERQSHEQFAKVKELSSTAKPRDPNQSSGESGRHAEDEEEDLHNPLNL